MSQSPFATLEIRRTEIIGGDKVRYRVYSSANEFVAVIAENALMAMKLSNITEPYKVVRDLPHDMSSLSADKIRNNAEAPLSSTKITPPDAESGPNYAQMQTVLSADFTPLTLADLRKQSEGDAKIITAAQMMANIKSE